MSESLARDDVNSHGSLLTFVFTDVVGSTAAWETFPEAMATALARHDELIERAVADHGGEVVRPRGEGDSRFAVFDDAASALASATTIVQVVAEEAWPPETPIKVRTAVHSGRADRRAGDYYGSAVNRCARLRAIAHPGQVLTSQSTVDLALPALGADLSLVDLGVHRLKDLVQAERVFQVNPPGRSPVFPALRSLDAMAHNLPVQATSLVGREALIHDLVDLVGKPQTRLVTLTGPGGIGKTRVALQTAAELLAGDGDGVWFVDLAPLADAGLVAAAIAAALGVEEVAEEEMATTLQRHLAGRRLLLVLDNFEHVLEAAPLIAGMMGSARDCTFLVTSREPLRVRGEQEIAVPALGLPEARGSDRPEVVAEVEAVQLFVNRAAALRSDFRLTADNAGAVAAVCIQLDGLPLAIELAAARIKILSPAAMLSRLEHRLPLLTTGARDLPQRQRTLRATIAWSHDLLSDADRALFRRLSVFAGGTTFEAVEAVCNQEGDVDPLEGLTSLVDKSMLRQSETEDGSVRFAMLETMREFAAEQLQVSGEAEDLRRAHASFYQRLLDRLPEALFDPATGAAECEVEELGRELPNLRAALLFLSATEADDAAHLAATVALASSRAWALADASAFLDLADHVAVAGTRSRGELLVARGVLDYTTGRSDSEAALRSGVELVRSSGAKDYFLVVGLCTLSAMAADCAHGDDAVALSNDAVSVADQIGNPRALGLALSAAGYVARVTGDHQRAVALARRCVAVAHQLGDLQLEQLRLTELARALATAGELAEALDLARRVVDSIDSGPAPDPCSQMEALGALGQVLVLDGRPIDAVGPLARAVELEASTGGAPSSDLGWLGIALGLSGDPTSGAVLWGSWLDLADKMGGDPVPHELADRLRRTLGDHDFERLVDEGRARPDQAVTLATQAAASLAR